ncbi:MAG: SAM-dependent methyltransferase [Deltaproteobacteria bacterium]|nr:SAM-dependent methyltransferase [Deltaproteobacteria bacterium]
MGARVNEEARKTDASNPVLAGAIRERISKDGPITFAEFMRLALYSPGAGYYAREEGPWGPDGDYITNLDLGPAFAKTIARQIAGMWEALGRGPFTLVEAGAGRATLSLGILEALRDVCPGLSANIEVKLVDRKTRPGLNLPPNVSWHGDISEITPGMTGVILSNELIDSFPAHRVVQLGGELREIYAGICAGRIQDVPGSPSTTALAAYLKDAGVTLIEGQRCEINLDATDWIRRAGGLIERGFVMTIDYGLPGRELYAPETGPTLHCHCRHTLNNAPYANIGTQDITTRVDFTALARYGGQAGLAVTGFTTQKNFLLGLGITDELAGMDGGDAADYDRIKDNGLIKQLIMPHSMGDAFKVLVQHKGVERPALAGFSWRDMSRYLY